MSYDIAATSDIWICKEIRHRRAAENSPRPADSPKAF